MALPADLSFAKPEDATYMIEYSPEKAGALLDDMGMKLGGDGFRTFPDGTPFTILWEYSSQFANAEFVKRMVLQPLLMQVRMHGINSLLEIDKDQPQGMAGTQA